MPERLARGEAVAARALAVTVRPSSRDTVIAKAWLYGWAVGLRCDQSAVAASSFRVPRCQFGRLSASKPQLRCSRSSPRVRVNGGGDVMDKPGVPLLVRLQV